MDGAVRQAQGGHCGLRGFTDALLDFWRLAGRRDVDGFLEIGAFQRVGFVEQRQGLELSRGDHAFEREFTPRNIVFDEQIAFLHASYAQRRFAKFF